ncbi:amino acid ABC transporter permease [Rhizobium grahamii]|uniref:Amino acid ABC transporter permease n=1 Tax=Rhizobium grahamii TaxID=1120045 RepID=A0A5Q0C941_9HYPH|nr:MULTISPECIES: amino acid ABC transporter permease [Rhizobium]QFY60457.1 amino acid ABC transporter permease [Rhizobium grahamii]QRM50414.1 amino acid ABC transporter permease [Rhizobium sp. BG6]
MREFSFLDVWQLIQAAEWTVILSLLAFIGGGLVGVAITLMRISRISIVRRIAQLYILVLQGTPLLIQIFLAYFGLALLGIDLPPIVAAAIALTAYASAFFGEIWRGAVESIPKPQWEGSASLGLTRFEQIRYVIAPQAMRVALPPTVGFAVQIVKNTSLAAIIGLTEVTRIAQFINNVLIDPITIFGTAAAIYFALCFPLSVLSRYFERRLHVDRPSFKSF